MRIVFFFFFALTVGAILLTLVEFVTTKVVPVHFVVTAMIGMVGLFSSLAVIIRKEDDTEE